MKKNYFIKLLVAIAFAPSVSFSQEIPHSETIPITIADAASLESADLFKSIEILPLEFTNAGMIQKIEKIIKCNDKLYVLNRMQSRSNIVIFNLDGTLAGVLDRKGKGPGEYVQIFDFDVDPISNNIWLYDGYQSKTNIYNNKLDFVREFKMDDGRKSDLICFQKWNPSRIIFTQGFNRDNPNDNSQILVSDRDGLIIEEYLKIKEQPDFSIGSRFRLQSTNSAVAFFPAFSDNVYYINHDSCFVAYELAFDQDCIKPGTRITSSAHSGEVFNQSIIDSDLFLHINYMFNGKVYLSFYNKKTKQITTVINPWNDISNQGYLLRDLGAVDNKMVFEALNMDIHEILSKIDKDGSKLVNPEILKKIDPEAELSNPILVFAEL